MKARAEPATSTKRRCSGRVIGNAAHFLALGAGASMAQSARDPGP